MKKILFILLCFSLFACSKESSEVDTEDTEQQQQQLRSEILNMFVGKWELARMASDKDFTNLIDINYTPEEKENNYLTFSIEYFEFLCQFYEPTIERPLQRYGHCSVDFLDNIPYMSFGDGRIVYKSDKAGSNGAIKICSYSETTFVFYFESAQKYLEYKKVL